MKSNRRYAFISTPNPERRKGNDGFFAQDVMHDAIMRAAGFTSLLHVPDGWRRSVAVTQPVKKVSGAAFAGQLGTQL